MDLLDDLIRTKAEKAGATAEVSDAVAVLVRSRVEVRDGTVKVLDGSGNVRVGGAAGGYSDMTLDEYLAEVKAERPALFATEAPPEAANPYAAETRNATAQARLQRDDPQRAAKLKAAVEPNPFHPATVNLTRQYIMLRDEPERAAKLKAEALTVPVVVVNRR